MVLRFGEKGLLWIAVEARGVAAHGAHVHKGENAIDRLRAALDLPKDLERLPVVAPAAVVRAIAEASSISEAVSGVGETDTPAARNSEHRHDWRRSLTQPRADEGGGPDRHSTTGRFDHAAATTNARRQPRAATRRQLAHAALL